MANNVVGKIYSLPEGDVASCITLKPREHLKLHDCLGIGTLQKT